ncbi:Nramp family divalent metal transporter [Croceibacter atlanticus]|uniref:Nramp family divalent metal transporter n=1 Tax=Croceibacter atlanticus TaxID=313588 RepID=UPI000C88F2F1|nr:manganese transporter [Croceibacter sp.]WSP33819.1 Nramp family divalent metal transporter [Croceibacter atlanticus]
MKKFLDNIGPSVVLTAAFIGPGTITVCTLAGVNFGFSLLWALLIAIFTCIVLQGMTTRLGIVTQRGLSDVIKDQLKSPYIKWPVIVLIFSAIVIGNAAYEAGNISGASLGLQGIFPSLVSDSFNKGALLIGIIAFVLLYFGNNKLLERTLIALVVIMSISFIIAMVITGPNLIDVLKGLLVPNLTSDNILTVVALLGTTVVPYNIFLHTSLVSEKWKDTTSLSWARKELIVAVLVGGVVSMSILICAASSGLTKVNAVTDLAEGLAPLFSSFASLVVNIGLIAAGITSAITAPLAAAYVAKGCFGWEKAQTSYKFRLVWMFILITGIFCSSLKINPIEIIKFAQITNGIVLPLVAILLLWLVNNKSLLGSYRNNTLQNILGVLIVGLTVVLGVKSILKVIEVL